MATWATYYTATMPAAVGQRVVRLCADCAVRQQALGRKARYVNTPTAGRLSCDVCGADLTRTAN